MLISYLEKIQSGVVGITNILGVFDYLPNPGVQGDPTHPPFVLRQLQLSKLGDLLTKPNDLLSNLYDWGKPGFGGSKLMPRLRVSLGLLGLPAELDPGALRSP